MISFNSFLLNSVEIKTSWAVLPFLAIALYPFIVFTDNLIINLEDLPLALEITAGVIVLILFSIANFWSIGIRPSIFVLWFKTNLPNLILLQFYWENFVSEKLTLSLKWLKNFEVLLYLWKRLNSNDLSNRLGSIGCNFYFFNCHGCLGKKWRRIHWHMISFLTYEVYLSKFLILTSFVLLIFITFGVIYISYISWKDKKRIKK